MLLQTCDPSEKPIREIVWSPKICPLLAKKCATILPVILALFRAVLKVSTPSFAVEVTNDATVERFFEVNISLNLETPYAMLKRSAFSALSFIISLTFSSEDAFQLIE